MPLSQTRRDFWLYVGIGVLFVFFVVVGRFYAPNFLDRFFHWFAFAGVTAFVFGYQLYNFWDHKRKPRFWLAMILLFACHFEFWVRYVHPHFGGDPRWLAGGTITFMEYVIVSGAMKLSLPFEPKEHG